MDELFERMGGFDGVEIIAKDFAKRVTNDAELYRYFVAYYNDSVTEIHRMGMALLLGASSYGDKWIRDFSRKVVTQTTFSDSQFERMCGHLIDSLYSHDIRNRDIASVIDFIQAKKDVLLMKGKCSIERKSSLSKKYLSSVHPDNMH